MEIIDLSFMVESNMPTCGTPWHQKVVVEKMGTLDEVGRNTHRIILGSHSGTHMDAPLHFIESGKGMETLSLDLLCGKVSIVDFSRFGQGDIVSLDDVKALNITERMLFKFGWYKNWKTEQYYKEFPYFSQQAICYLLEKGMRLMAMDTPSPDCGNAISDLENDSPNHKILLQEEVIIIEYLNNTDALKTQKEYELIALPLKVKGSDGCPCRVIAREIE